MLKNPIFILLSTLVLSVFGGFFRWLQHINAFDEASGFLIAGRSTTALFTVFCILAVAAIAAYAFAVFPAKAAPLEPQKALYAETVLPRVVGCAAGACAVFAGLMIMIGANLSDFPTLRRVFGALCVFMGVSFPFFFTGKSGSHGSSGWLTIFPVLFSFLWLICGYKFNAYNPVIWAYGVEIIAIAASAGAFLYLAAFHYGRANPRLALLFSLLASFFCITTLSDSRPIFDSMLFVASAAVFLCASFIIIKNASPRKKTITVEDSKL